MRRHVLVILIAGLTAAVALAQSKRIDITFATQDKNPKFDAAVEEYRRIWAQEGGRIIEAMGRLTTLKFPEGDWRGLQRC